MLKIALIRFKVLRQRSHEWLVRHPRLRNYLNTTGTLKSSSEAISRGVAIGLFIGLTPTVGFQTLLTAIGCILFTGNFPVAFATSFVSNPFTMVPFYWGFHELGEAVFMILPLLSVHDINRSLWGMVDEVVFTGLGSLLVATPVSLGSYLATRHALTTIPFRKKPHQAHRSD